MFVQLYWPRWPRKLSVVIDRGFVHFGVNKRGEWYWIIKKLWSYIDANCANFGGKKKKKGGVGKKENDDSKNFF